MSILTVDELSTTTLSLNDVNWPTGMNLASVGNVSVSLSDSSDYWGDEQEINADPVVTDGKFGTSVEYSADGQYVVVGSPLGTSGRGYIYKKSETTLVQDAILLPSAAEDDDAIGGSCTISADGKYAALGATGAGVGGKVFIFSRNGSSWIEHATLSVASTVNDDFGVAVSLDSDGTRIVIGANKVDTNLGTVYVFKRTADVWALEATLTASDRGTTGDEGEFGSSLHITPLGTRLVVGAPAAIAAGSTGDARGQVYTYNMTNNVWVEAVAILSSDTDNDRFGSDVKISADGTVVLASSTGTNGFVDCFSSSDSWATSTHLTDGNSIVRSDAADENFGENITLSLDARYLAVSAKTAESDGRVYLFKRMDKGTTWVQLQKLATTNVDANGEYGTSISLSGDATCLMVGAPVHSGDDGGIFNYNSSDVVPHKLQLTERTIDTDTTLTIADTTGFYIYAATAVGNTTINLPSTRTDGRIVAVYFETGTGVHTIEFPSTDVTTGTISADTVYRFMYVVASDKWFQLQ
jgi:hypothetical protein